MRGGNAREGEGHKGRPRWVPVWLANFLDWAVREENHRHWQFLVIHILILCLATNILLMSINIYTLQREVENLKGKSDRGGVLLRRTGFWRCFGGSFDWHSSWLAWSLVAVFFFFTTTRYVLRIGSIDSNFFLEYSKQEA